VRPEEQSHTTALPRGSRTWPVRADCSPLHTLILHLESDIMDVQQQRGRSPSAGQHHLQRHSPSPSPHVPYQQHLSTGFNPSLPVHDPTSLPAFDNTQFLTTTQSQQYPQQTALDQSFLQANQSLSHHSTPHFGPQGNNNLAPDALDIANSGNPDFSSFFAGNDLNQVNTPYLGNTLDPQLLEQNQSMNQMATTQAHSPTPPHLMPTMHNHQKTPSPHASPNMNQAPFPSPGHSRNASLDPSAAYGQPQGSEWGNMANFRGHRRAPSETYSDVSSAHPSPYLVTQESFEENQPSPLLDPQSDPQLFHDPVMQFGQFTLNDGTAHISPGHSPSISPRLLPQQQQALPQFQPGTFGLEQGMSHPYGQQGLGVYPNSGPEPFPSLNQVGPDFGQADAMSPPEINIDFAPPSRQPSFEPPKPEHQVDALSPPDRCKYSGVCVWGLLTFDSTESQPHAREVRPVQQRKLPRFHAWFRSAPITISQRRQVSLSLAVQQVLSPVVHQQRAKSRLHP